MADNGHDPSNYVRWFDQIGIADLAQVGGKNASLGEMIRELVPKGVRIPNGFAVTADAFRHFLASNNLDSELRDILAELDTQDIGNLSRVGRKARQAIMAAAMPPDLNESIVAAYRSLGDDPRVPVDVAVRSSATAEDLPDASFAGQQETYLNVEGESALLEACHRCFASLFTDRAISYRTDKGFGHFDIALSIGVQKMVRSDLAASGVMFSVDTETGFPDVVLINAAYGLGENVVQGSVNPDEYYVFKPTLKRGHRALLRKVPGTKELRMVYDEGGGKGVRNEPVPADERLRFAITDDEILTLARWACIIEDHYSDVRGQWTPMDMEWGKDGHSGELFILQARPETVHSQRSAEVLETYRLKGKGPVVITGRSVGDKIGQGPARIIQKAVDLEKFQRGEVLITDKTDPDWEPVMKKAAAIVTNRGGRTCHAAIVSRELGLPAIVGCGNATDVVKPGSEVTVSCAEGETGFVYEGAIPFEVDRVELSSLDRPKTAVMMNVANPEEALSLAAIPNDGVGLARLEFIIGNYIGIHPLALLNFDRIEDRAVKDQIAQMTVRYDDKAQFFVDRLAEGVAMIGAAFYPKDVIVRMSDFKSNEYADLIGGAPYEPHEENPMIGFRGASRYYDDRYRDGFALECRAMKKVREDIGLTNVKLMIPFCRTTTEARRVQEEMAKHGLARGVNDLDLYVMCEIPSNVIEAEAFAELFDGFSIGSNDLTQLVLGVDRDSEIISHIFDERDPAVKTMIATVIRVAKEKGRKIGICGQAPSDYPEFTEFLVNEGIDSISLLPDSVVRTTLRILDAESKTQH